MVNPVVRETALTLGAGRFRTAMTIASEAQAALLVACITGFGRVVGEVGISLILGGNILGYTRTITTAISLQTSRGEFALGLALGIVLICAAFVVNITARLIGRRFLMSTTLAYSIRSLMHSYDGRIVLEIPSLEIPSGQICAIVGPNGCGKTTLLSILALLLQPVSGSVRLFGVETAGAATGSFARK